MIIGIFVDLQGDRYPARISQVFPPKSQFQSYHPTSVGSSLQFDVPGQLHAIGSNLKIPFGQIFEQDDPLKYFYKVQILDEDRTPMKGDSVGSSINDCLKLQGIQNGSMKDSLYDRNEVLRMSSSFDDTTRWCSSLLEVRCNVIS